MNRDNFLCFYFLGPESAGSSSVECELPKLERRVRFPLGAPLSPDAIEGIKRLSRRAFGGAFASG